MSAQAKLAETLLHHPWLPNHEGPHSGVCPSCPELKIHGGHNSPSHADHLAEVILAAGYSQASAEQVAAVKAMERIRASMDAFFKGEAAQFETLGKVAESLGAYEIERI